MLKNASRVLSSFQVEKTHAITSDYEISNKVLGKGAYAEVRLGERKDDPERTKVAIKILDKTAMSRNDLKKLNKEVSILKKLNHKNIVRVFNAYDEADTFFIVMEYVSGGELFNKIVDEDGHFNEEKSREIIKEIAEALKYCKEQGVVHRDIKPENILLTPIEEDGSGGEIKLADFNLSRQVAKEVQNCSVLETMCGTPNYVAPEVISGKPYDYKCDIWSLGIIAYLLLSGGFLPFYIDPEKEGRDDLLRKVKKGKWTFSPIEAWENVSPQAKEVITIMLDKNPSTRATYEEILNHEWFQTEDVKMKKAIVMDEMINLNEKRRVLAAAKFQDALDILEGIMNADDEDQKANLIDKLDANSGLLEGFNQSFGQL